MARISKCKECGKQLSSEEKFKYSNKTYCKDCFELLGLQDKQGKTKTIKCKRCGVELTKDETFEHNSKKYCKSCYNIAVRDSEEYKNLIDYIYQGFQLSKINGLILRQIKKFRTENNYSYAAIHYTLYYMLEVCEIYMDVDKYGIALVEKYYSEAESYFLEQVRIKEQLNSMNTKSIIKKKIVKKSSEAPQQNSTLLDVDALLK